MPNPDYDQGGKVRVTGTFTDPFNGDAAIDPTAVYISIRNPSGTVTTYQYGVEADVKRSGAGVYYYDIDVSSGGKWYYRWWSTGTGQAAEEGDFLVATHKAVE